MVRAALIVLLLAGCATRLPATVEVQVPVAVPCVQADEIPARPAFLADRDLYALGDYDLVLSLAKDRRQRQVYEALLEGVLSACVGAPPKARAPEQPAGRPP